jgi:hypothetical protein
MVVRLAAAAAHASELNSPFFRRYPFGVGRLTRCCPTAFSNRVGQGLILLRFILRAGL